MNARPQGINPLYATVTAVSNTTSFDSNVRSLKQTVPDQATSDKPQWQQQRSERKRLVRNVRQKFTSVTGSRNADAAHKLKGAEKMRSIYIREVDCDMNENDIKGFMSSNKVRVIQIRQILGKFGLKKSFKVTIPEAAFDEVMIDTFWPRGIEVREWLTTEQLRLLHSNDSNDCDDEEENDDKDD